MTGNRFSPMNTRICAVVPEVALVFGVLRRTGILTQIKMIILLVNRQLLLKNGQHATIEKNCADEPENIIGLQRA